MGVGYHQYFTLILRAFIIGAIVLLFNRFLGVLILSGAFLQSLGENLPQADHYNMVIIAPLTVVSIIYIFKRFITKKHVTMLLILWLVFLSIHQISFGLEQSDYWMKDKDVKILKSEYDEILYRNTTFSTYPIMLLRNTPEEVRSYLISKDINISNPRIKSYYCQQGCDVLFP